MSRQYRPLRARSSPLWQCLHDSLETFTTGFYPDRSKYLGPLDVSREATLHDSLRCGDLARGFLRVHCPDCDQKIASLMAELEDRPVEPIPEPKEKPKKTHNEPLRQQFCEKFGVDLTAVEGVSIQTCLTFLSEMDTDFDKFASAEHFASWMGLCLDNRITGGRTHAAHTRKVQNRLATALRMAAQSLHRSKAGLGDWFRRIKSKLGTKAAVTAAAHKLARILWAMIKYRSPYKPSRLGNPELARAKKEAYLRLQATRLRIDTRRRSSFIRATERCAQHA